MNDGFFEIMHPNALFVFCVSSCNHPCQPKWKQSERKVALSVSENVLLLLHLS